MEKPTADKPAASPPAAVNMFTDAGNYQNEGQFVLAVEEWEKFLQKFPKDPLVHKARHYAGVCHLQLKNLDKAAVHFQQVIKDHPNFELAEDAYLNLGWCQFSLAGKATEAAPLLTSAAATFSTYLDKFPKGKYADQAWYFLGESQYQRGQKKEALGSYQQFLEKYTESSLRPNGIYALGVTQEELGQFAEAGKVYDRFLKEFAKHDLATEVRMRKGETLLQSGSPAEAERIFADVAKIKGFSAADYALSRQALCALKQDKLAEAGDLYGQLVKQFPESAYAAEATIAAGRSLYAAKKYDEAAPWFDASVKRGGPETAEAAHWLCRIYLQQKEAKKVVELADQVLAKVADSPYLVHLQMDQADALYELSEWRADAVDRYVKLATAHPQHELAPQALYNAAFGAMELKRFDDGIRHAAAFEKQYAKDRLLPDARFVAAECQLLKGDYSAAEEAYRQLLDSPAEHADRDSWQLRLALSLYLQKKYSAVVSLVGTLVSGLKDPAQVAEAHYLVGASCYQDKKFAEAATALQASLQASRTWKQADETLLFLAGAQRSLDKLAEAKATVQQLIDGFADSKLLDQAYYRLGDFQSAGADYPAAVEAFDVVLARFAESPLAPYAVHGKGWAQFKGKEFKAAIETFSTLLAKYGEHALAADAHLARGMARRQAGELEKALEDFAAYLQTNPAQPGKSDALYERGLAEVALGSDAAAAKTFASIIAENKSYALAANVLYELGWACKKTDRAADAVTAFARLVKEYPDSPFVAEASFHVGEDAYDKELFAEATKAYAVAKQKGEGEIAEKALYKLGWTHFKLAQYEPAATQFAEQVEKFQDGPLVADAHFMKAECLFKLGKFPEAFPAFRLAIEHQKPTQTADMRTLAYLHGGQSAAQLQQWQTSLELLDQIPAKFPESAYAAEALYERGWAKQNLMKLDDAVADYEQAALRSRGEIGARARFMIGEIQFERREHEEAVKSYLRVMYGYGGTKAPEEVKKWQATAGFEAGRCAEVQIQAAKEPQAKAKLLQDAKTYYLFVTERHPEHKLAAQAKQRLAALSKLP